MDWLKSALAKVYATDGLLGVVVVVVLLGAAWWLFGAEILAIFGQ